MSCASQAEMQCNFEQSWNAETVLRDSAIVLHVTLLEHIGSGASGRVYKAIENISGRQIAVKIVDYFDPQHAQIVVEEARIHLSLQHQNIAQLYKFYTKDNSLIIHMEFIEGGDFESFLRGHDVVEHKEADRIINQLESAVQYLHDNNVFHCDINIGNVMLDEHGNVKLIDFGAACSDSSMEAVDKLNISVFRNTLLFKVIAYERRKKSH